MREGMLQQCATI